MATSPQAVQDPGNTLVNQILEVKIGHIFGTGTHHVGMTADLFSISDVLLSAILRENNGKHRISIDFSLRHTHNYITAFGSTPCFNPCF